MLLKHICPHLGCHEIIPITQPYCDAHVSRHKQYDQSVRLTTDAKYHAFYVSSEWEQIKAMINNKYHGLCLWSYYQGIIVPYKAIHHIISLREEWNKRIDIDNLIPLTQDAHAMVEAEYKHNKFKMQKELFELKERWDKEFGGCK